MNTRVTEFAAPLNAAAPAAIRARSNRVQPFSVSQSDHKPGLAYHPWTVALHLAGFSNCYLISSIAAGTVVKVLPETKDPSAEPQTFGSLTIERRVLLMDGATISIPSISSIAVRTWQEDQSLSRVVVILMAAGFGIVGSILTPTNPTQPNLPIIFFLFFALLAFAILVVATKKFIKRQRLVISTNDGSRTFFEGNDVDILEKVRRVLSDKINAHDEHASFQINLEKGIIQNLNVEEIASVGTIVSGTGNQVASGNARIGTSEIVNSPGAQLGDGNVSAGNTYRVDYSQVIPTIQDWRAHYLKAGHPEIAARLQSIEALMQAGTPSKAEKSKLRELVTDLPRVIGAAGDVAQFFRMIVRMAT